MGSITKHIVGAAVKEVMPDVIQPKCVRDGTVKKSIEYLVGQLVKTTPNDQELGKEVRRLIREEKK